MAIAMPTLSIFPVNGLLSEGNSGATPVTFTVTLSSASISMVTVDYATLSSTAKSTSDFTDTIGTLIFNPGETTKTFVVPIIGDVINESDEIFSITLSNSVGATLEKPGNEVQFTIINDDSVTPTVSISPTNGSVNEGNSGTTPATFTVTLSSISANIVTVDYSTTSSTAKSTSDFTDTTGTLIFNPGETTKTFIVAIIGDTFSENSEIFSVTLSNSVGATLEKPGNEAQFTIINDDSVAPMASIFPVNGSMNEGDSGSTPVTFTVVLSSASSSMVTVDYATSSLTAKSTSDFTDTTGTLTFNPGETRMTFVVPIIGDVINESNEIFSIALSNPVGVTLEKPSNEAQFTIINDEASFLDPSLVHDLTGSATFWKTGSPIPYVTCTFTSVPAASGTQPVEFRNIHVAADGSRSIEIWETSTSSDIKSVHLGLSLPTGSAVTWQ